jgi:hypothetical protein
MPGATVSALRSTDGSIARGGANPRSSFGAEALSGGGAEGWKAPAGAAPHNAARHDSASANRRRILAVVMVRLPDMPKIRPVNHSIPAPREQAEHEFARRLVGLDKAAHSTLKTSFAAPALARMDDD